MVRADEGVWLYAVTREVPAPWLADLTGVDGEQIRVVVSTGLMAIVGTVDLADFGEQVLPARLEDIDVLAALARDHDGVIEAAVHRVTTAPMRLATMYFDDARVGQMLKDHHDDLDRTLRLIDGCEEWGVKGFAPTVTTPAQREPETSASRDAPGGGAAYLRRRRSQLMARDESENMAYRRAELVHDSLVRLSKLERRHPPQDPKLTGVDTAMVLNGAYLVPRERAATFAETVAVLGRQAGGLRLELTGPWPAYSFTGLRETTT